MGEENPPKWKTCSVDNDCAAIEVNCGESWGIGNKNYINKVPELSAGRCRTAGPVPGPRPVVACINGVCVQKTGTH